MNCKQGELAIVVKSFAGNEGKIVRCKKLLLGHKQINQEMGVHYSPAWETESNFLGCFGGVHGILADFQLRPLRDSDGEDETLQWAPVPSKELVHD